MMFLYIELFRMKIGQQADSRAILFMHINCRGRVHALAAYPAGSQGIFALNKAH